MIVARWTFGAILAATAASASTHELQFFARLLKRQDPGSPSYNCHDNCGQAIIQGRSSTDVCHDDVFLTDYKACLQCAGPDNQDIWQYYGNTLTKSASSCGLSTSPLSGKQPDVGPAIPAGSSSATSASESPSPTASATETSKSETSETEAPTPTETPTEIPTETPTEAPTEVPTVTESSTEAPTVGSSTQEVTPTESASAPSVTESHSGGHTATVTESAPVTSASNAASTTHAPTGTGSGIGSGSGSGSENGTAPTSTGVVVVGNAANAVFGSAVGFYGALALGALYAVAQ